jgi:hypothetical protein
LQSIWYWLLVLTGVGLFFDVAVRRIAVDPAVVALVVQEKWRRLRGLAPLAPQTAQFLERLKSRKEQVSESLEKEKAGRRFEGGDVPIEAPPMPGGGLSEHAPPVPAAKPPKVAPDDQAAPADYASRLLRAKRKALEERDKDNPPRT